MSRRIAAAIVLALVVVLAVGAPFAGAKKRKVQPPVLRPQDPVVLTGQALPRLLGESPGRVVAYRYTSLKKYKQGAKAAKKRRDRSWTRIPVQVDERAVVDFGDTSTGPPSAATVYGTPAAGKAALQYTDPNTFVGPDPDATFDANDELVVMAKDAWEKAPRSLPPPPLARKRGATRLAVTDPIAHVRRWIYLFRAKKAPGPAPTDYVHYDFRLNGGNYKSTYNRADGPNPETSVASTSAYTAGFSDRWYFDQLRIKAGGANQAEILDGYKFNFPGTCTRSEATFNDAEGAFIVNKDGPVRAIRSYVGANSGPYTERTHFLYQQRQDIVTDLRVHPVPSPQTHYDLSAAAMGMTYLDQAHTGGATVDGVPDSGISGGAPVNWHLWRGAQGSFFAADRIVSSFTLPFPSNLYEDNSTAPSFTQCWGDPDLIGAAGITSNGSIPSTDFPSPEFLRATSVNIYAGPGASAGDADLWSRRLDTPLAVSASAVRPPAKKK
jgi:hypothetical protein